MKQKINFHINYFLPFLTKAILLLIIFPHSLYVNQTVAQNYILELEFVSVPSGTFLMGADLDSKYINAGKELGWRSIFIQDEFPRRKIHITQPFEISKYEITNAQFEKYDPSHKSWRGYFMNISRDDNEAVIYVSWEDAAAYTKWLSDNDTIYNYRLPTEAEWEYAARANTKTPYNDDKNGNIYTLNPFSEKLMEEMNYRFPYPFTWSNGCRGWVKWLPENCLGVEDIYPDKNHIKEVNLTVGRTLPNNFGIYDMCGGVEEWVYDWYGPYDENDTINPYGYKTGDFKVTRGGSHNNHIQHARSANRMSAAINDKHYFLGFRIVRVPKNQKEALNCHLTQPKRPHDKNVNQDKYNWEKPVGKSHFSMSSLYELVSMKHDGTHYGTKEQLIQFGFDGQNKKPLLTGPLYTHNHSPTITWAENGDLLISWFSGESEIGTELTLLASRGKRQNDGSIKWTHPSELLKAADRNMHSSNLLNNAILNEKNPESEFTLHQMASIGIAGRWDKLALGYRKSINNGESWSPVKMVLELDHAQNDGASMQGNMLETEDGTLIFVTDDDGDGTSNTGSLVVSNDNGNTWERRGHSSTTPDNKRIAGLHAAIVEINDINNDGKNDLMAIARDAGKYYSGKAPKSISTDNGYSWSRMPSEFPSIRSGQRFALLKLRYSNYDSGTNYLRPLLLTGFANDSILGRNGEGKTEYIKGLYAAVSFDDGKTWPENYRRVISNQKRSESLEVTVAPWQRKNLLTCKKGQEDGYMSVTQTPDGMIYLTDGKIVYSFNLEWIVQ